MANGSTDWLWEETSALVERHWAYITAIAAALLEQKTLTRRQVCDLKPKASGTS
jgi:hypothetical protein